jgi:hypothetical protein
LNAIAAAPESLGNLLIRRVVVQMQVAKHPEGLG